ncbi:unnamed protein product [Prunus armeniaca]
MSQGDGPRHECAEGDTKLSCLQGDVLRHGGAEDEWDAKCDTKFACRKAMWLGTRGSEATQSLHVARQCG